VKTFDALQQHGHPDDTRLWIRLAACAFEVARGRKLELNHITLNSTGQRPASGDAAQHCLGWCDTHAQEITLVLRFKGKDGGWLGPRPEADVWKTLAHELAHLEVPNHSPRFWAMMSTIQDDVNAYRWRTQPVKPGRRVFNLGMGDAVGGV
jgi:hypothetical protein